MQWKHKKWIPPFSFPASPNLFVLSQGQLLSLGLLETHLCLSMELGAWTVSGSVFGRMLTHLPKWDAWVKYIEDK